MWVFLTDIDKQKKIYKDKQNHADDDDLFTQLCGSFKNESNFDLNKSKLNSERDSK